MRALAAVIAGIGLLANLALAEEQAVLKSQKDKISYSIGLDIGKDMKRQSIDIDPDILAKGIKDALSGNKPLLSEKEMQDTMIAFQKELAAKQGEKTKRLTEKNKKEGEAFLAANKKKEGVKTTSSGLQYKIIKEGAGKTPKATDTVTVHYRGTLLDGTEFDSSYKRGQPASFPVNDVITGWTEALQMMKTGSKWQLFIPPNLAYGERGAGPLIGPNAVLVFEVELLSIK
ncbi:MAG: FKBP-type peptidyl-prolyl cis-trans isomerase [Alphaproteobacteria bacterium]|uniref:Peptidyl-prolyl cis-trans isomerase n=1 Tax=Candidatus Nitrobium versatile TaxID=2884831 RepID=A0A953SET7_9BACT|nr:FKBP-type peptidyl-prolyl cis-trans isomerase [Candidatus Nitrobium versatile]